MEKLVFVDEDGTSVEFYVEEQTRINGRSYLLVTDAADDSDEPEAYILKDMSQETAQEAEYVIVDDDVELEAVSRVFEQMLENVDIEM
ncbi:MAG TPA: DUF1292 domain-containing protein [Candidatus Egerieimonas intestinavium]|uniref:DUF1292 domain-containing protein n=1 Tax=Candidatus Egerieimonas intestinavium TaxID=2840777 RepID=A0A9D1EKQ1_9FIRM|nr:DUF1292 domain-containing protein [Candidatus Egerieimonas intestinavium]